MGNELRTTIREAILSMERPFNISDLFYKLEANHGIRNRPLILEILDELCDNGVIDYSEINDDCWAFNVVTLA